jgi:hypothetical protein
MAVCMTPDVSDLVLQMANNARQFFESNCWGSADFWLDGQKHVPLLIHITLHTV